MLKPQEEYQGMTRHSHNDEDLFKEKIQKINFMLDSILDNFKKIEEINIYNNRGDQKSNGK